MYLIFTVSFWVVNIKQISLGVINDMSYHLLNSSCIKCTVSITSLNFEEQSNYAYFAYIEVLGGKMA